MRLPSKAAGVNEPAKTAIPRSHGLGCSIFGLDKVFKRRCHRRIGHVTSDFDKDQVLGGRLRQWKRLDPSQVQSGVFEQNHRIGQHLNRSRMWPV